MLSVNQSVINQIVELILKHENPARIYLFGSRAQGVNREKSDIDIAIDDAKVSQSDKSNIHIEMDKINTLLGIDVLWLNDVSKEFKKNIIEKGVAIYGK